MRGRRTTAREASRGELAIRAFVGLSLLAFALAVWLAVAAHRRDWISRRIGVASRDVHDG